MSEVVDITDVWHGMAIGGLLAYGHLDLVESYGFVMNVAWELARDERGRQKGPEPLRNGKLVHHGWLDDNFDPEGQAAQIQKAVALVRAARAKELTCLVTCAEGRNRSALVVAEALIQEGAEPSMVIAQIQARRDPVLAQLHRDKALTNHAFVAWLKRER